ncbi:hypothetical protein K6119_12030 [Paracrocinitomix mangrovi]|uniref:hypothetical protein n=1 Tax=Paracrocinitomix mangrovi TaxID=2862509 RepID=UPI001C8DC8C8|nr:hypothetical protein [Paracrocinitomix mangrovi]UKN00460.1 hypothetical protein K6119_12030 [Paracrocinitomix mangrovi]
MKKVRMTLLLGLVFIGMSSCASMLDNINVNCEDCRTNPNTSENFEFDLDSNCE